MTDRSYQIDSTEPTNIGRRANDEQDLSRSASCMDDCRLYPMQTNFTHNTTLGGLTNNAVNASITDEQYQVDNRTSENVLHNANYDVPSRRHEGLVATMFRNLRSESPAVVSYGSNIPYSHDQMATLQHMWHVQDAEIAGRSHADYMSTDMVKDEPCSSMVDSNGARYQQGPTDLATEMEAMEKASIDFLTGSILRNRIHNTTSYPAPAGEFRCPPRPVDLNNKTDNQAQSHTADIPALQIVGQIKNNSSDSQHFEDEESQTRSSTECSPKLENEDIEIRSSLTSTDSQSVLDTEHETHMPQVSSSLRIDQESNKYDTSQNIVSRGTMHHVSKDKAFDGASVSSRSVLLPKYSKLRQRVTFNEARKGLMKVISFLKSHPDIAEDHVETLQNILKLFNRTKTYVVKKKRKTFIAAVAPSDEVNIKIEAEPRQEVTIRREVGKLKSLEVKKGWKSRPHKCSLCFKRFVHECNLQKHFEKCSDRNPSKCTDCDKIFSTERALVVHKRTHTGEKPYLCTICGQSFTQNDSLQKHQTIHTGEMPFTCTVCDKKFARASYLKNHMVTHSEGKLHMCSECGKSYRRSCELQVHMRCHTNDRRYKCSHCDKGFTRLTTLNDHERTHTGEKPHKCDVCGQSFAQSCALRNHKRTHTGERPYGCSVCGETFSHSGSLYHHKKIHGVDRKSRKKYQMNTTNSQQQTPHQDTIDVTSNRERLQTTSQVEHSAVPMYHHYAYNMLPRTTLP